MSQLQTTLLLVVFGVVGGGLSSLLTNQIGKAQILSFARINNSKIISHIHHTTFFKDRRK